MTKFPILTNRFKYSGRKLRAITNLCGTPNFTNIFFSNFITEAYLPNIHSSVYLEDMLPLRIYSNSLPLLNSERLSNRRGQWRAPARVAETVSGRCGGVSGTHPSAARLVPPVHPYPATTSPPAYVFYTTLFVDVPDEFLLACHFLAISIWYFFSFLNAMPMILSYGQPFW